MTDYKTLGKAFSVFCKHTRVMAEERKSTVDWYKNCARWYRQEGQRCVDDAYWLSDEEYALAEEQKSLLRSMGCHAWDMATAMENSIQRVSDAKKRYAVVVLSNKELR